MRTLLCSLLALLFTTMHAQQWNWAADAGGGGNVDFCYGIATDSQGNAYWVGSASGDVDFGCATLSTGSSDVIGFLAKRAPDGTCLWVRGVITTLFEAWTYGVAVDAQDHIYITGKFQGNADFGSGVTLDGFSGDDIFLARFDTAGSCIWARRADSSSDDEARGVDVSAQGDVFLTGFCGGTSFIFDGLVIPNPGNFRQIVVARYDSTGTVQWAKASTGNGQGKSARAISVAGDRLFVTGQVGFNAATFDGIPITPGAQGAYLYVLATDLDGNAQWARSYGTGDHEGMGIAADSLGNLFVTGRLWGDLYAPDDTLTSVSANDDILLIAMDQDGNHRWAKSTGSTQRDVAWGVAADGLGNAYVSAHFNSTIDFFGTSLTSLGSEDILISKLDTDGDVVWAQRPSGFQRDIPLCIHRQATAPHELYFGGYFWGAITYGSSTIDDVNNGDAMIVSGIDTTFDVSSLATDVCPGACDGSIDPIVTGGTAPFSFQWNNGSTMPELDGLCPGFYIVEVMDANGQVIIDTVYIEEHTDPGSTVQVLNDSLWTNGGTAWEWFLDGSTPVSDSASAIALQTGSYHALVTDAFGCVWSTDTATIVLNVGVNEITAQGLSIRPNPATDDAMIEWNGDSPAQARLFNSAGQCLSTRMLLPGTNVLDLTGLDAGVYVIRTEDGRVVRLVRE